MKVYNVILTAVSFLLAFSSCGKTDNPSTDNGKPGKPDIPSVTPGKGNIVINWENDPQKVCPGAYARVHKLNDGRYMLVYSSATDGYLRFSADNCRTWQQPSKVFIASTFSSAAGVTVANAEFAQLRADNPHHPNRIIYAANLRPKSKKTTKTPYSIAIITSDDNGAKWSEIKEIYASRTWDDDVERGCYEPFVLELPDGTVQVYFADETPYYKDKLRYQNISVMESSDGGDTWTKTPRIVSYNSKYRDGMPVAMLLNDKIYVAIEENGPGTQSFHPKIVCSSAADNYIVLSYLSSEGASEMGSKNATMEFTVCAINEMTGDGKFTGKMRGKFRPFSIDQTTDRALWGALCDLGSDTILAVTEWNNSVWIRRGRVVTEK